MAKKKLEKGTVKKIIVGGVIALLCATVIGLGVGLSRQIKTETLGNSAYEVGTISTEDGKADTAEQGALYTKDYITVDGLRCDIKEDGDVTYQVFYYGADKAFIGTSDVLSTDLDATTVPEGAKFCRVVITPTNDNDGKIGFFEKGGYVDQVDVTVYKQAK